MPETHFECFFGQWGRDWKASSWEDKDVSITSGHCYVDFLKTTHRNNWMNIITVIIIITGFM